MVVKTFDGFIYLNKNVSHGMRSFCSTSPGIPITNNMRFPRSVYIFRNLASKTVPLISKNVVVAVFRVVSSVVPSRRRRRRRFFAIPHPHQHHTPFFFFVLCVV